LPLAWALFPGDVAYIWHGGVHAGVVQTSLEVCDFAVRSQIGRKSQLVISRGHYHAQHGPCLYALRDGRTGHWTGDRKQTTLWQIDKPVKSETGHSKQKPVECMKRPIKNNSSPGQAVYEPFSGSGNTIIAARRRRPRFRGRRRPAVEGRGPSLEPSRARKFLIGSLRAASRSCADCLARALAIPAAGTIVIAENAIATDHLGVGTRVARARRLFGGAGHCTVPYSVPAAAGCCALCAATSRSRYCRTILA
jgi:hypothetical protein